MDMIATLCVKTSQKPEKAVAIITMAVGRGAKIGKWQEKATKINVGTLDAWKTLLCILSIIFRR